jgi:hypothetical protein
VHVRLLALVRQLAGLELGVEADQPAVHERQQAAHGFGLGRARAHLGAAAVQHVRAHVAEGALDHEWERGRVAQAVLVRGLRDEGLDGRGGDRLLDRDAHPARDARGREQRRLLARLRAGARVERAQLARARAPGDAVEQHHLAGEVLERADADQRDVALQPRELDAALGLALHHHRAHRAVEVDAAHPGPRLRRCALAAREQHQGDPGAFHRSFLHLDEIAATSFAQPQASVIPAPPWP